MDLDPDNITIDEEEPKETALKPAANKPKSKPLTMENVDQLPSISDEATKLAEAAAIACFLREGEGPENLQRFFAHGGKVEWFLDWKHQDLFSCIVNLDKANTEVNEITLYERYSRVIEKLGGLSFIFDIQRRASSSIQLSHYIQTIKGSYLRRRAIRASRLVVENLQSGGDLLDAISKLEKFTKETHDELKRNGVSASRPLSSYGIIDAKHASVLLGENRYLCRGGMMVTVSSAGMGKSALSIQEAICYALGKPFFGIQPNGFLTSLVFQSEDDDGDIGEVVQSCFAMMKLTEKEIRLVGERVRVVTDRVNMGDDFIRNLKAECDKFEPDLVWINPLQAFFDGDITRADDVSHFIRQGLQAANKDEKWAYMLIHHTTKPVKDGPNSKWSDIMYNMAGSADIINAVRAVRNIQATDTDGEFVMHLSKRGRRAGVKQEVVGKDGSTTGMHFEITTKVGMKHCRERFTPEGFDESMPCIFWEPCESAAREPEKDTKVKKTRRYDVASTIRAVPEDKASAQPITPIFKVYEEVASDSITKKNFRRRLNDLINDGLILQREDGFFYRAPEKEESSDQG